MERKPPDQNQAPDRNLAVGQKPDPASAGASDASHLPEWFGVELARAQMPLLAYIGNLVAGSPDAWDILQDANRVLCQKASDARSADEFLPWAYTVAKYKVLQYRQRLSRDRLVFSPEVVERLADRAAAMTSDYAERLSALHRCLAKLSELQRKFMVFRYVDELSVGEIARRTSRAENAVSAALHRARAALAQCVETALAAGGLR
jgi:RNA polymerase sigma-70 factor (ECF subfamily)